jgi:hypothetical protein
VTLDARLDLILTTVDLAEVAAATVDRLELAVDGNNGMRARIELAKNFPKCSSALAACRPAACSEATESSTKGACSAW